MQGKYRVTAIETPARYGISTPGIPRNHNYCTVHCCGDDPSTRRLVAQSNKMCFRGEANRDFRPRDYARGEDRGRPLVVYLQRLGK
jgi:hypothetical protein